MDSDDEKQILKLHNNHAAIREFAEYVQMLGEGRLNR